MKLPYIDMIATGENINNLRKDCGLSIKSMQIELGFSTPNAIYKWIHGYSLPTIDNLVILSKMLNVSIDSIVIVGDRNGNV